MPDPHFLPWVGSRYPGHSAPGPRFLLLGESHYGDASCDYPEFTRDVVQRCGVVGPDRYFTMVGKLVLGLPPGTSMPGDVRARFYDSVAFYNYVPQLVGPKWGIRPSPEHWSAAEAPFRKVLSDLRPQVVLVLGKELWSHLNDLQPLTGSEGLRRGMLPNGEPVTFGMSMHPSAPRFRIAKWQAAARDLFGKAGFAGAFNGSDWR